jgi:hypothetical protein
MAVTPEVAAEVEAMNDRAAECTCDDPLWPATRNPNCPKHGQTQECTCDHPIHDTNPNCPKHGREART